MKRNWGMAVRHHAGQGCRVCGNTNPATRELAHVLPRTYDRRPGDRDATVTVDPRAVIPLCRQHHREYDDHRLDLWDRLRVDELDYAIRRVGRGEAERRIRGRKGFYGG